jgi:Ca2+-transporting ATPase
MVFAGLMGIIDPPREGVKDAIRICKEMGVRVVMITGDAKETAVAIAENLGILRAEGRVLSGIELEKLDDEEFSRIVNDIDVYCRVEPKHKMRIINALKKHRHVVAMTGDGVNDAPALKSSDIGIAMGRSGADVAKESADMILVDDNFTTIEGAIEEGKSIYNNIKNFLRFQLSTNVAALATIFTSTIAGLPLPLNPIQILWINILMDGPPAQSLSVEPLDKEVTKKPPRDPDESILSKKMVYSILFAALIMYVGTLALFKWQLSLGVNEHKARTMAFTLFVMFQMFNAFNCRSEEKSLFEIGIFSNKYVILAVAGSIIMQVGAVYLPILQNFFGTVVLNEKDWAVIILISSTVFLADEIRKRVIRG